MGARESKSGGIQLRLCGSGAVHDATLAAREFAAEYELADIDTAHLAIVVEELVTNLFDYGGLSPDDVIELSLTPGVDGVALMLTDPGKFFDPRQVPLDAPTPDRGGGAGSKLVRRWASGIDYRVADGRNRLTLTIPSAA